MTNDLKIILSAEAKQQTLRLRAILMQGWCTACDAACPSARQVALLHNRNLYRVKQVGIHVLEEIGDTTLDDF